MTLIFLLISSCSADTPRPKITSHDFRQKVIIYYDDGIRRVVERTLTCEFSEARYLGGDWHFFWRSRSHWLEIDGMYEIVGGSDQLSNYGAVRLHSSGNGALFVMLGQCSDYMGLDNIVDRNSETSIIYYDNNGLGSRDNVWWREFSISNIDYMSDPRIINEVLD